MASSSKNNPPAASHSHHSFLWHGGTVELHLESESSINANVRPSMLVELELSLQVKFVIPSPPPERGSYRLWSLLPSIVFRILSDNPSSDFATINASEEAIKSLATRGSPALNKILGLLVPDLSRMAHATLKSAEAQGHKAMKVLADAIVIQRMVLDLDKVDKIADDLKQRTGGDEEESLGTCAVCLEEVKREWIRPVILACSHVFHFGCISTWLQRKNSCPLCRSKHPIDPDS